VFESKSTKPNPPPMLNMEPLIENNGH